MDTTEQQQEPFEDNDLESRRSITLQSLDEIANDVGIAMRDAHLDFPVGLTVPRSGNAIVTMPDWFEALNRDA